MVRICENRVVSSKTPTVQSVVMFGLRRELYNIMHDVGLNIIIEILGGVYSNAYLWPLSVCKYNTQKWGLWKSLKCS